MYSQGCERYACPMDAHPEELFHVGVHIFFDLKPFKRSLLRLAITEEIIGGHRHAR